MNLNYVDEALDKAGELSRVIRGGAWQRLVVAFYEVDLANGYDREIDENASRQRQQQGAARSLLDPSKKAEEDAAYVYQELALSLHDGEVYAVDPEVVELLQAAAGTMPPYELRMDDAPSMHGFVWFPDGLLVRDVRGKHCLCRALTWTAVSQADDDTGERTGKVGYVVTCLTDPLDPRDDYHGNYTGTSELRHFLEASPEYRAATHWSLLGQALWEEGTTIPQHGELVRVLHARLPGAEPAEDALGGYEALGASASASGGFIDWMNFVAAFWRFVQEPYVEHRHIVPGKAARKRAEREERPVDRLRVVRLRKSEHSYERKRDGDEVRTVEWSHRWRVEGHWRNQWYPSLQAHRPKWIPAYIKGPADKPLVIKDVAYLVDR